MYADVEVEITQSEQGLIFLEQAADRHPVDSVCGILNGGNTDDYFVKLRGQEMP